MLAGLQAGSTVVFDYAVTPERLSPRERAGRAMLMARTAAGGEPWKSAFDPAGLSVVLRSLGYGRVEDLGGEALATRYLAGRTDALRKSNVTRLCIATMGDQPEETTSATRYFFSPAGDPDVTL